MPPQRRLNLKYLRQFLEHAESERVTLRLDAPRHIQCHAEPSEALPGITKYVYVIAALSK